MKRRLRIARLTKVRMPHLGEKLAEQELHEGWCGGGGLRLTPPLDEELYTIEKQRKENLAERKLQLESERAKAIAAAD